MSASPPEDAGHQLGAAAPTLTVRLDRFSNRDFDRGRSRLVEFLWLIVGQLLVHSGLPGSRHRVLMLPAYSGRRSDPV